MGEATFLSALLGTGMIEGRRAGLLSYCCKEQNRELKERGRERLSEKGRL